MPRLELADGLALFYHDEGAGEPLVLIHGFPLSSEMYQPQRAALSSNFRVITPDLRGMGRSDTSGGALSMATYADDIIALLDQLGIGQAVVGGMSMGGYVVFELLRRHPERVKGVILIDTRAEADSEEARANRLRMIEQARSQGAAAIAEAMLPRLLSERTRQEQPALARFVYEIMAATPVEGIIAALQAMAARRDATDLLPRITVPTLIIVGSEDQVTPPSVAQAMQQAIPDAELVIVEGAAHAANLERPDEVNQVLRRWLQRFG